MKVALLSTPLFTVPPPTYGGVELVVADLGKGLAKLGHDVTIFAPEGSKVEGCKIREVGKPACVVPAITWGVREAEMFEQIKGELGDFDIIHGNNWFAPEYKLKNERPELHICHTHHGGINSQWTKKSAHKMNTIAISDWMKSVYEKLRIPARTVYNGVDLSKFPLHVQKSDRFLWLSRMCFWKAPHIAIQVAKESGIKLDVAGATCFSEDARYVEQLKKDCDGDQIRFIGEVTNEQKVKMMGEAKALIVTAKWGEPFGLHVLEAMATGTGVLAIPDGALKETIKAGGILCKDEAELAHFARFYEPIDPEVCRWNASLFGSGVMSKNYEKIYKEILDNNEW